MIRKFLLAASLFVAALGPAQAVPVLTLTPSAATVTVGTSFTVSIGIADVEDLFAWETSLLFAPIGTVGATTQAEGDFFAASGQTFVAGAVDNLLGIISGIASSASGAGVSGAGVLAIIGFDALAVGVASFSLDTALLLNSNLDVIFPFDLLATTVTIIDAVAPVPEPAVLALVMVGLAGVARQRRHAAASRR